MACSPVCGDNPRALASGLSYVQVDKHGITFLHHLHQCRPCTSSNIHAKVGKGGIKLCDYFYVHTYWFGEIEQFHEPWNYGARGFNVFRGF